MFIHLGGDLDTNNKIWGSSFIEEIKKSTKQAKLDMLFSDLSLTSSMSIIR